MDFAGLIVGVSGHVFEDDVAEFVEAGADLVLAKPLCIDTMKMLLTFIAENSIESGGAGGCVTLPRPKDCRLVEQNHRLYWKKKT